MPTMPTIEVPVDGLDLCYLQNLCAQNIGHDFVECEDDVPTVREEHLFRMIELKRAITEHKKTASGGHVYIHINHSEAMHLLMHCNHIVTMMPENVEAKLEQTRKRTWVAKLRKLEY